MVNINKIRKISKRERFKILCVLCAFFWCGFVGREVHWCLVNEIELLGDGCFFVLKICVGGVEGVMCMMFGCVWNVIKVLVYLRFVLLS